MDISKLHTEVRKATQRLRRPPTEPHHIRVSFEGGGELGDDIVPAPVELIIEATNAAGELAGWFSDYWWTEVIQRWGEEPVTVHIAPTPSALLHPVMLNKLEMLRRVASRWRVVGHTYASEVATDDAIESLATSPYDEVRFIDQPRPGVLPDRRRWELPLGELFGCIRRAQERAGTVRPILTRLPSSTTGNRGSRTTE